MLDDYLNQAAYYSPALRNADGGAQMDERGQIQYGPLSTIYCRRTAEQKEVMTPDRQIIKITDTYYTISAVDVDDLLDGRRVQYVKRWAGLDGDIVGYKAVV